MPTPNEPTHECCCGALIYQRGKVWINPDAPVFTELCYPNEEGPDGEAMHQPYQEVSDE